MRVMDNIFKYYTAFIMEKTERMGEGGGAEVGEALRAGHYELTIITNFQLPAYHMLLQ